MDMAKYETNLYVEFMHTQCTMIFIALFLLLDVFPLSPQESLLNQDI
jgi:hypothetical protein